MKLVEFPRTNVSDIPQQLRNLANDMENGAIPVVHNVAYVIDRGNGEIELGLLGQSAEQGAVAHLLLSLGVRLIEKKAFNEV